MLLVDMSSHASTEWFYSESWSLAADKVCSFLKSRMMKYLLLFYNFYVEVIILRFVYLGHALVEITSIHYVVTPFSDIIFSPKSWRLVVVLLDIFWLSSLGCLHIVGVIQTDFTREPYFGNLILAFGWYITFCLLENASHTYFLKFILQLLRKKYPQFGQLHNGTFMQQVILFSVLVTTVFLVFPLYCSNVSGLSPELLWIYNRMLKSVGHSFCIRFHSL